jgi:hypothetical protein
MPYWTVRLPTRTAVMVRCMTKMFRVPGASKFSHHTVSVSGEARVNAVARAIVARIGSVVASVASSEVNDSGTRAESRILHLASPDRVSAALTTKLPAGRDSDMRRFESHHPE